MSNTITAEGGGGSAYGSDWISAGTSVLSDLMISPTSWINYGIMYKQRGDEERKRKLTNKMLGAQAENVELQNKFMKEKLDKGKKVRNLLLYGK